MNDCHSDVSPVNKSDLGAFGYFLRIINWSPVGKSAQQVSYKKIPLISLAGTQCIELLTDLHICTSELIPVDQQVSSHLIFEAALV